MASEVVPDILNGLVAAGTLALAGATVYVGRIAVRSALDTSAPRVVVTQLWVPDPPVNTPVAGGADAGSIQPGTTWSMRQHGLDRVGLRASGHLRNEGTATVLFSFEHSPDVEVDHVTYMDPSPLGGPAASAPLVEQEGWYVIRPSGEANFRFIWWKSASDWAAAWDQQSVPTVTARLLVRGVSGQARDRCDLTFGGYVMVPHPREDGWVVAIVNNLSAQIPGTAPPRLARIGLMRRAYPGPFRRNTGTG
jgi:hypothetical protein